MADPVGSVSLAIQISNWAIDYANSIENEAEERSRLLSELAFTLGLLYGLRDLQNSPVLQDQVKQDVSKLEAADGVLVDYIQTIRDLRYKVEASSTKHKILQKLTWYFVKKEGIEVLELAIQMDHAKLSGEIAAYMRKIGDDIESIKNTTTDMRKEQELIKTLTLDLRDGISSINEARAEDELQALVDWITTDDPWTQHNDLSRHSSDNTGVWFLESVEFHL